MAEKHSKSKLKRHKSSVKDVQTETGSRGTVRKSLTSLSSRMNVTAETGRSVWWSSQQLPAVESLWASTLQSALPYLENQHWDLVPDLPHPSAARPAALTLDEQRWCDLSEEVAPFPEPSPSSTRTSSSPDPLRLSSSQQELSVQTEPVPEPPDGRLSSHSKQTHVNTTSLQALAKRPRLSPLSREGPGSSSGSSNVGGDKGRKGGGQEEETGAVPVQREGERNEEEVEDEEEEEVQRRDGGAAGGGAVLQSCPMCLLVFPVGFSQMDCDGHLAQCLSEVNVDMTCIQPDDFIYVKLYRTKNVLHPRWTAPGGLLQVDRSRWTALFQVLLTNNTAVKWEGRPTWIHASHRKRSTATQDVKRQRASVCRQVTPTLLLLTALVTRLLRLWLVDSVNQWGQKVAGYSRPILLNTISGTISSNVAQTSTWTL